METLYCVWDAIVLRKIPGLILIQQRYRRRNLSSLYKQLIYLYLVAENLSKSDNPLVVNFYQDPEVQEIMGFINSAIFQVHLHTSYVFKIFMYILEGKRITE